MPYIGHMRRGGKPNHLKSSTASILMLTANDARSAIYDLADVYSWETIAKEMIAQMSGNDAREFVDFFERNYND